MSGNDYVARAYTKRRAKDAPLTPAQKAHRALKPVLTAPVTGDPEAIDWLDCATRGCTYQRPVVNGRPVPQTRDPAWGWTEEANRSGKPCLRTYVRNLALQVYQIGYRHNNVELYNDGGFPDDLYWGRGGLIVRELKAMRPDWKRGQKQHLLSLREAEANVMVWRPCCVLSGLVDETFAALSGRRPCGPHARGRQAGGWADLWLDDAHEGAA